MPKLYTLHQLLPVLRRLAELPEWDPAVPGLKQKRENLIQAHSEEWAEDYLCKQLRLDFQLELAVRAKGNPAALLKELPSLAKRASIFAVDLEIDEMEDGPDCSLPLLAKLQVLRVVHELRLHQASIRPKVFAELLESSVWKRLQILELKEGACEPEILAAISGANLPSTLTELKTQGFRSGMGDEGLRALAHANWLPQLQRLDLRSQCLTDAGLVYLAMINQELNLQHLDLGNVAYPTNKISADGLRALAERTWFQELQYLGLAGCAVGDALPRAFSQATELRTANMSNTGLHAEHLKSITAMPSWHHLQELSLTGNPIGDDGAEILAGCTSLPGILDLRDCNIGADGLSWLAKAPEVWSLDLRWNPINGDDWAAAIATNQLPHASTLAVDARDLSDGLIHELRRHYPRCDLAKFRTAA